MTTTAPTPHARVVGMGRAWLLEAAATLEAQGQTELAAEARAEANAVPAAPAEPAAMRCDDCGRPVGAKRHMPEDWAFDWWSHRMNGNDCQVRP